MNFKFNRRKIKYVVKPEERMVTGWIDMCDSFKNITSIENELYGVTKFPYELLYLVGVDDIYQQDKNILKAVSRCDDRDEFDEKIGKKIVADILEKKYHILMMKKYRQVIRKLEGIIENAYSLGLMHENRFRELQTRIDKYNEG